MDLIALAYIDYSGIIISRVVKTIEATTLLFVLSPSSSSLTTTLLQPLVVATKTTMEVTTLWLLLYIMSSFLRNITTFAQHGGEGFRTGNYYYIFLECIINIMYNTYYNVTVYFSVYMYVMFIYIYLYYV